MSATVTPSEVSLTPGADVSGTLVLSNTGEAAMRVQVEASGNDASLDVDPVTSGLTLEAASSVALEFRVTRSSEGVGQDTGVRFVVTSFPATGSQTVRSVVVATLKVKAAASLALIEAKVESNVTNINENRPGAAALVLSNPREATVRIDSIQVHAPDAIEVTLSCTGGESLTVEGGTSASSDDCSPEIPPRSQEVLPLAFETTDRVAPGSRTVLLTVTAAGAERGSQSVVASTSFTVDVFAESDILKGVGVPVFLLLPGVIIVVTGWFLITKLSPWRHVAGSASLGSAVSAATATAILGLAVSLVVALLYPVLTRWFVPGYERDYLKAYGFRDFYYVIGYSFAIAILVWLLAVGGFVLARSLFLPWPGDTSAALLRKIGIRGLVGGDTRFPRVTVDGGAGGLKLGDRAADKAFVVPVISVSAGDGGSEVTSGIESLAADGDAFRLWRRVKDAVRQGAKVSYRAGGVREPCVVDRSKVALAGQEVAIVEVAIGE